MMKPAVALLAVVCVALPLAAFAQGGPEPDVARQLQELQRANEALEHRLDELAKAIDDVAWFARVGDVAVVDKWRIVGPPDANPSNPEAPGARNPVKFYTYTFVPKDRPAGTKLPMLILPHGGVHADFTTYHTHIIRELMAQGYVVVAPDYRGSTGYGQSFYELIDYGGREVDDIQAAKDWAIESFDFVDPRRVGLRGVEPRRAHRPPGRQCPPHRLRLRVCRSARVRPHRSPGLPRRGLPAALLRPLPHRQERPRGHPRVQAPLAGVERRQAARPPCSSTPPPTTRTSTTWRSSTSSRRSRPRARSSSTRSGRMHRGATASTVWTSPRHARRAARSGPFWPDYLNRLVPRPGCKHCRKLTCPMLDCPPCDEVAIGVALLLALTACRESADTLAVVKGRPVRLEDLKVAVENQTGRPFEEASPELVASLFDGLLEEEVLLAASGVAAGENLTPAARSAQGSRGSASPLPTSAPSRQCRGGRIPRAGRQRRARRPQNPPPPARPARPGSRPGGPRAPPQGARTSPRSPVRCPEPPTRPRVDCWVG